MGCKCGRDILYSENEIIKAESFRVKYNKKNKNPSNSKSNNVPNITNQNFYKNENYSQYNNIKPEINYNKKNDLDNITMNNMNGSQRSSINTNPIIENEITNINDYPQRVISLINEIRSNPILYSQKVEESINNIKILKNNRIIYYNVVKVALHRGEEAFRKAINILKTTESMGPLRYNPQLCIPLPENETELNDQNFLQDQVDKIRQRNTIIEIYYKDLIKIPEVSVLLMIVDDNSKNTSKKRDTLLNKDFRYIGVNCKFIGKHFVAHFSFSG